MAPIDPTEFLPTGITCSFPDAGKPFTRKKTAEKQYLYLKYVIITKLNFNSFCHFVCVVQQMDILKWSLGQSRRGKCRGQKIKYWYQITCMDVEDLAKHYYEWKKINMSVGNWT